MTSQSVSTRLNAAPARGSHLQVLPSPGPPTMNFRTPSFFGRTCPPALRAPRLSDLQGGLRNAPFHALGFSGYFARWRRYAQSLNTNGVGCRRLRMPWCSRTDWFGGWRWGTVTSYGSTWRCPGLSYPSLMLLQTVSTRTTASASPHRPPLGFRSRLLAVSRLDSISSCDTGSTRRPDCCSSIRCSRSLANATATAATAGVYPQESRRNANTRPGNGASHLGRGFAAPVAPCHFYGALARSQRPSPNSALYSASGVTMRDQGRS